MWRWRMFLQHSNAKTVTAHNLADNNNPHYIISSSGFLPMLTVCVISNNIV